jgi:hypothetical protein
MHENAFDAASDIGRLRDHVHGHEEGAGLLPCCDALLEELLELAYIKGKTVGVLETSSSLREAHRSGRAQGWREAANPARFLRSLLFFWRPVASPDPDPATVLIKPRA